MEQQITAAKDALAAIKEQYAHTHNQLGFNSPAIDISDEEDGKMMDVASARILEGMQGMIGSLTQLKETADQMVEEQQKAAKRPRLEEVGEEAAQPFPTPGKTEP